MNNKFLYVAIAALIATIIYWYAQKDPEAALVPDRLPPTIPTPPMFPLKPGSKGKAVKLVQIVLDLPVDGIFGNQTAQALKKKVNATEVTESLF